ncbi:kinase-like protein, partial [Punctularia strigosozonata HHB-11173 SS5]|uniref:kinase-like protein n=1 Tax=Punctularia strigosozonata (strain HHB-11173) TaxID=741275 RepID=UPI0004417FF2
LAREALFWRQLKHPHILPLLGIDTDSFEPHMCMVSPLMLNGTLLDYIRRSGPHNVDRMRLCIEVMQGVCYLHENKLIHGDLRACNVFVDSTEQAVVSDFGLISFVEQYGGDASSSCTGNPRWMAPELQSAWEHVRRTTASDVYSLGCLFYEVRFWMITLHKPFAEIRRDVSVVFEVARGARPTRPAEDLFPMHVYAENFWGILVSCWLENPDQRPSAASLLSCMQAPRLYKTRFQSQYEHQRTQTAPVQRRSRWIIDCVEITRKRPPPSRVMSNSCI